MKRDLDFLSTLKVPVHEIAMMMSIALRFIPILIEETDKIMKAQMARGGDINAYLIIALYLACIIVVKVTLKLI